MELAELKHTAEGGPEWKETARWIKYEEDVEGVELDRCVLNLVRRFFAVGQFVIKKILG